MAIRKYTNGAWAPTSYRKFGTETDTITSIPAQIIGDGQPITSCQIYGNTVQDGTPTPEAPVDVVGCGVKTGNLFDKDATDTANGYITNGFLRSDGSITTNEGYRISEYIRISQDQSYNLYYAGVLNLPSVCFYDSEKKYISGIAYANRRYVSFTKPQNAGYLRLSFYGDEASSVILNAGTEPLPWEPYGYKLPLTCGGTEYPIYLGQVQSTRKIKKLVLTGEEAWIRSASRIGNMYIQLGNAVIPYLGFCDRAVNARSLDEFSSSGKILVEGNQDRFYVNVWLFDTDISITYFKSYLAAQYANGTPVTVWFVLATPETGIVNEPLMKIGDYADTVSATNIPTTGTPENFDVLTTLKPSEVQLTYHGWHEHTDTKYTQGE